MDLILKNPYRIAGILSNASERELQKQKTKIKAYTKVGKEIKSDFDFQILGNIDRTEDSVNRAFSNVEQNEDKVNYALFWFLNASPLDNTAIEYLKNDDKEKALEIWEKVTTDRDVNSKNFSAFNNLGTYKLLSKEKSDIKTGIEVKIKLIESDYFENFVHSVADQTFTIDSQKQSEKLIDELLSQFKNTYSSSETLKLFSGCNGSIKKYLSQKFTEEPIHKIESHIESCKKKRKDNKSGAYEFGLSLFANCKDDLSILKSLLGAGDLKYKVIADQLANEIMQCGIDYFNELQDYMDPSEEGMKLLKYAQSIAVGSQTKDRAIDSIQSMQELTKTSKVGDDVSMVTELLKLFQSQTDSLDNARALIISSKDSLNNIKNVLGSTDEFYLNVSSAVVNNSLQMVIEVVNEAQNGLDFNRLKLLRLPDIISKAVSVNNDIGTLDMNPQTRQRFLENVKIISGINSQMANLRRQISSSNSSSSGCYIATMAYGDYDHPQVLVLRKFRDEFLNKTLLGRSFIKFYYKHSPSLVERLKNNKSINRIIRKILDQFIKSIKK